MLRRSMILALPLTLLRADEHTDALDAVAPLAAALSEGDAGLVLETIPRGDEQLRTNIRALVARASATSSVEVVSATKDSAELDWYLEIRNRTSESIVERRRGKVQIRHRRGKLTSLAPASFFAPPAAE